MADATYDRNAAFEMLSKKHGSYATPEMINEELDNFERENNLGTPKAQPQQEAVVAPLTGQDKAIADQASVYSLSPTTARETVNAMTASPVGSTSLPDVASAAWNNLSTPEKYAVGTGVTALSGMAIYGAKKLVDRFLIPDKQVAPIDRTRDIPLGDHTPPPPPPPPSGPKLSPIDEQILSRQNINRQVREEYLNRTRGGEPTVVPTTVAETPSVVSTTTNPKVPALLQPPVNPAAPVAGAAAPVETTPKKAWEPPTASLAVSAPATPTTAPVETTTSPAEAPKAKPAAAEPPPSIESKLGKPTLITGSGMPAYEGQGAEGSKLKHKEGKFASLNDIPKGTVFVPGGNYMDTLRNAVGQQAFTENLKATGGYPASNEATAVQARAINASLNRPTREQAIAQGLSLGEPTPPITKKVGGKKLVSVAGVTGALIALPDLANAAQNQDAASAGRLSNTAGALGLATMMGRAVPAVPPTLPTLGQSIGGRSVNMNPDFLNQLLR